MTRSRFVPAVVLGLTALLSACLSERDATNTQPPPSNNLPPVALVDVASVMVDSTNNPINVLANDTDPNGDALTIESAVISSTLPTGQPGTLSVQPDGALLRFTPPAGFVGVQILQYTVSDGHGGSATAAVTVTVLPVALPPVAVPDVYTVPTDSPQTTLAVLANDVDGAGGGLTIESAASVATIPPGSAGTVEIVDNALDYTPPAGFTGAESLQYTIVDANGATATTTVLITIAPITAPPIAAPDAFAVAPDSTVALDVLANDIDLSGTGLSLTEVSSLATVPPGNAGTFVIEGDHVLYTPAAGFIGVETAQYTVTSGTGQTATGAVTIVVAPLVSALPPVAIADAAMVSMNATASTIPVLANDIDTSGTGLAVTAVERLGALPPVTADSIDTDGTVVTYTPAPAYSGLVTLLYTITDGNGHTSTAPIVITVSGAALPPIAVADIVTIQQDSAPINIAALSNDIDVTSTGLDITSVSAITTLPPGQTGTSVVAADGQSIIYQPLAGFTGIETLNYGVTDGNGGTSTGVITILVQPAALAVPPLAIPDVATVAQDSGATLIDVLANDLSPSGSALTLSNVSPLLSLPDATHTVAVNSNKVSFTPAAGFVGIVTLQYTVSDGTNTATGTVAVTVQPSALTSPPVALPDIATVAQDSGATLIDVVANDISPTGAALTVTDVSPLLSLPDAAHTVGVSGNQVSFTPAPAFAGIVTLQYTVSDGTNTATGTVAITVTPSALTPSPVALPDVGLASSGIAPTPSSFDVLANDIDPSGTGLTLTDASITLELPPGAGSVAIVGNQVVYTPAALYTGSVTVSYTAQDALSRTTTGVLVITVTAL